MSTEGGKASDAPDLWTHDLFGCFEDVGLCIFTFLLPCYTIGRNAEALGEDGMTIGILYGVGLVGLAPVMRWRVRQMKNIEGTMMADAMVHCICPCCALIQENKTLYGFKGSHAGEKLPLNQDMPRQ